MIYVESGGDCIESAFTISALHEISLSVQIMYNEMGGSCGTYGGEERCIQAFGGETLGKETTWKVLA
jgi:hypothetical protein